MKRSEIINIIITHCLDNERIISHNREYSELTANLLLNKLENAGMLPPANGMLTTNFTDMGLVADHSWESEEENG